MERFSYVYCYHSFICSWSLVLEHSVKYLILEPCNMASNPDPLTALLLSGVFCLWKLFKIPVPWMSMLSYRFIVRIKWVYNCVYPSGQPYVLIIIICMTKIILVVMLLYFYFLVTISEPLKYLCYIYMLFWSEVKFWTLLIFQKCIYWCSITNLIKSWWNKYKKYSCA